ncbi:MAG: D-aminoacyl-tRNA deacylase [Chloracidobacterium sp.]|uniref:D-aminoacyl-tRNA deacylase n=1 Tax=Chloracidobacterium validum TaxID=2821543 RepID=A0ABX8BES6_9BACT|nr:D-aminoacyl-tRNA deacylase [Chloracidobacterium validum]QUW03570.1 D-tyrosyl-tRNA(Tyr) deacylase [Chloracidobacterium validum]
MRLVIQRVTQASVTVGGDMVGRCGRGLCILVGVTHQDTEADADWLAEKTANLRIFEDTAGKMNQSLLEIGGGALVVSQFTLYGDARKGRRPSFTEAAPPTLAEPLVRRYADALRLLGVPVETGVFGALMQVEIHNDGPVTLVLERSSLASVGA